MSGIDRASLIAIRDAIPSDKNFIMATALRGLFYGGTIMGEIPKHIFMECYHQILESLLSLPKTKVKVACLKDDPEVILGYSILTEEHTLHFVFVKSAWRKIGIGKSLVPLTVSVATHLTKAGIGILRKYPGIHFNPFILGRE